MASKPVVIVNFKTYKSGEEVLKLALAVERVSKKIIVGVSPTDISFISRGTNLLVFSEHCDYQEIGRNTGYIMPESIKAMGAVGTFLNHSEHKLTLEIIEKTISRCKKIGLKTAVFIESLDEGKKIEKFSPDYLIYEPPELVGGDISVSTAKPEVISKIASSLKMKILVGAGVKNFNDFKKSLELGAAGIAVSSAITTAKDPEKVLKEMVGDRF